jgi:hypothetical protein
VVVVQNLGLGSIGDSIIRKVFKTLDINKNGELEKSEVDHAVNIIKSIAKKMTKNSSTATPIP